MIRTLYLLFFLSGAAALFYESVWARYLGLFVGHDAYAQVLVLVIFLGGMAVGAMLVSRFTNRIREPLFAYGVVEAAVGVIGLLFHDVYLGVTGWAYGSVFPAAAGTFALPIAKWGIAGLLILPQSVLLGATFPLMSAAVLRVSGERPGRVLSYLYFANSFGAALGVLVASFYLLRAGGLPGTGVAGASINLLVAASALIVGVQLRSRTSRGREPYQPDQSESGSTPGGDPALTRLLLGVSLGTAVASFIYEIDWIRMLALVLGSATHAFDLMLSAFIMGLALGALWIRSRADRLADPLRTLGIVQWVMGFLALATLPLYVASFGWIGNLLDTFAKTDAGYAGFTVARYVICLAIMLPATFCAGITLPLITRTLIVRGDGERAIGAVYGVNTLGSILGVVVASLILLPLVGLKAMLVAGAAIDMVLGALLLRASAQRSGASTRWGVMAATATLVVAVVVLVAPPLDRRLLTSGVYRFGVVPRPGQFETLSYQDGRTATVSVARNSRNRDLFISTNGKADASLPWVWFTPCESVSVRVPLRADEATQALAALLALAYAPQARTAATIGLGSGMSSHFLLGSQTLEHLTTIEIEPEMREGARQFYPANARVYDDPRSTIVIDDAKSYFAAGRERYDIILSEPSNPWVRGVSGLFTVEFYDRIKEYLTPNGVFGQWIHLYDINDDLILTVLSALHQIFPAYHVYLVSGHDLLIVAAMQRALPEPDWSVFHTPAVERDLCHHVPFTPAMLNAMRISRRAALGPILEGVAFARSPNSDFYPRLDLGTEKTRYLGTVANGFLRLTATRFDVTAPFLGWRVGPAVETEAPVAGIPRAEALTLAARLRKGALPEPGDSGAEAARVRTAAFRLEQWRASLATPAPPSDWRLWLRAMDEIEQEVAGGTAGVVDTGFYEAATRFLDRHRGPREARDVVAFRHAIGSWDFEEAARATVQLLLTVQGGAAWISADELRDGGVVTRLRLGDVAGARALFESLRPLSRRPPGDLRSYLLEAYILAFEERGRPGGATAGDRSR